MIAPLVVARICRIEGIPQLEWAESLTVRLPEPIAAALANGVEPASGIVITRENAARAIKVSGKAAHNHLRLRAAYTDRPPLSSRLPFSYRVVPGWARRLAARGVGRMRRRQAGRWAAFPGWPIDLSADFVADLEGAARPPLAEGRTPVVLTHDLDSPEGVRNLARYFLGIEEKVGARSCNYVVPCAWPLDYVLLDEVQRRGHEIGIHGYDHSNKTPFADTAERQRRLEAARPLAQRYGAVGYRAPSLARTEMLIRDVARLYRYDSSIPTAGGLFPVPNNGCASARPWRLHGIWEIPITLPRDGSLRFLGYSPAEIGRLWRETAETVARSGGVVCLLTHCETGFSGNALMLAVYEDFLKWAASDMRFQFFRPSDLIARLDQSAFAANDAPG
jgi:peptidoglycan/xylan/chitin deacetylase (PgdA/CDA1 family)